jgi:hypothetical protein
MQTFSILPSIHAVTFLAFLSLGTVMGAENPGDIEAIANFLSDGDGQRNAAAPEETEQFGALVGLWTTEAEILTQDGSWADSAPGVWAWKYTIDGFAVADLFYHGEDSLPEYMKDLGHSYMLTAIRIYDVSAGKWQIAWMANGAGRAMGADFGTFTAVHSDGEIVMSSPPSEGAFGLQRVVFHDMSSDAFHWKSQYSRDNGANWTTVMKIRATRHR